MSNVIKKSKGVSTRKCGDCLHFKGVKNKDYEDICKNIGIIATNKAPDCYCPDLRVFRKVSTLPNLENLGDYIKDLTAKQCRILSNLLIKQSKLKENKFYFGQKVYICLGDEYLSHYYKAYVLDVDKESDSIYIVSRLKNANKATTISALQESLLTQKDFNEKVIELSKKGRVIRDKKELEHFRNLPLSDRIDKNGLVDVSQLIRLDLEELADVPTLDKAPKEMLEQTKSKKKVKTLSDIVREPLKPKISKLKTHKED